MKTIDLSKDQPFHLKFLELAKWKEYVDHLSYMGRLTSCGYIRALGYALLTTTGALTVALVAGYLSGFTLILTSLTMFALGTFDVFSVMAVLHDVILHGGQEVLAFGYIFSTSVIIMAVVLGVVFGVVFGVFALYAEYKRARWLKTRAAFERARAAGVIPEPEGPRLCERIASTKTWMIIDSFLHKYCVKMQTSKDTLESDNARRAEEYAEREQYRIERLAEAEAAKELARQDEV